MNYRRILGRIDREEFVGRDRELEQIVRHPSRNNDGRGLLVLSAPPAGGPYNLTVDLVRASQ